MVGDAIKMLKDKKDIVRVGELNEDGSTSSLYCLPRWAYSESDMLLKEAENMEPEILTFLLKKSKEGILAMKREPIQQYIQSLPNTTLDWYRYLWIDFFD
jgi:hypothetical protein